MILNKVNKEAMVKLQLRRDLVREVKRGHAWVYPEALRELPKAKPGTPAVLLDNRGGREIARGYYDPQGAIALRVCTTQHGEKLSEAWAARQLQVALDLRRRLFDGQTTGYRLFNGEGDGLPGVVCDVYGESAVLKLDGPAAVGFWDSAGLAAWLAENLALNLVYERMRQRGAEGIARVGAAPGGPVRFLEHGMQLTADVARGQKTGFFLDQRENRKLVRQLAAGKRVLNVFGYTGGFSVAAGLGGAAEVITVDTAKAALAAADEHWALNGLPEAKHTSTAADAFEYLERAAQGGESWDLVILDPPSFAPSQQAVPQALAAYEKLIGAGARVTTPGGMLLAGSCSSHVDQQAFLQACAQGISLARRKATTLGIYGQPADHPAPLAMPELRYLKMVLLRVDV